MSGFVSAITDSTTGITSASLWTDVTALVPLIVIVLGFSFGYYVCRKAIKGASRGKVRM